MASRLRVSEAGTRAAARDYGSLPIPPIYPAVLGTPDGEELQWYPPGAMPGSVGVFTPDGITRQRAVVQGYVSVKDYNAVGDGIVDDTVAIQNALNAAAACQNIVNRPATDYPLIPTGVVLEGGGRIYRITAPITISAYGIALVAPEGCTFINGTLNGAGEVIGSNPLLDCFLMPEAVRIYCLGIVWQKFRRAFHASQTVQRPANLLFQQCQFSQSYGAAFFSSYTGLGSYAGCVSFAWCDFMGNARMVDSCLDETYVLGGNLWTSRGIVDPALRSQIRYTGHCHVKDVRGVGLINTFVDTHCYWLEHRATSCNLVVTDSNFSGEVGAGMPLVSWYDTGWPTTSPWAGPGCFITNCFVAAGDPATTDDAGLVACYAGAPFRSAFRGVSGTLGPYIRDLSGTLAAWIAARKAATPLLPRVWGTTWDANPAPGQPGATPGLIPIEMVAMTDVETAAPFPTTTQDCVISGGAGDFYYDLDWTTFFLEVVLEVTVWVNPAPLGSPYYRKSSTYRIYCYCDIYGVPYQIWTSPADAAYAQPTLISNSGALLYGSPTLTSVRWDPLGANSNIRPLATTPGTVRFLFNSNNALAACGQPVLQLRVISGTAA